MEKWVADCNINAIADIAQGHNVTPENMGDYCSVVAKQIGPDSVTQYNKLYLAVIFLYKHVPCERTAKLCYHFYALEEEEIKNGWEFQELVEDAFNEIVHYGDRLMLLSWAHLVCVYVRELASIEGAEELLEDVLLASPEAIK